MPKSVLTYRCLIISPSDVTEERDAVVRAIETWNAQIGPTLDARIEAVRWETHAAPELGGRPQGILNRRIVDDCDFAIAIFWTRLGTPTGEHESGSMEEIERLTARGARVSVYFSEKAMPTTVDLDQVARLRDARAKLQARGLVGTFDSTEKLRELVLAHITAATGDLASRDRSSGQAARMGIATALPDVRVSARIMRALPSPGVAPRAEVIYLQVRVENHSPSTVFVTGLGFELGDGLEGTSQNDSHHRPVQEKRAVESGNSADFLFTPDAIRAIAGEHSPTAVIAYDAIQRRFRGGLDLPRLLVEAEQAQAAERRKAEQAWQHEQFVSAMEDWSRLGRPEVPDESRSGPGEGEPPLYILRDSSGEELAAYRIRPGSRQRVRPEQPRVIPQRR